MTAMPPPTSFRQITAKGHGIPCVALCFALGLAPALARGQEAESSPPPAEAAKRKEAAPAPATGEVPERNQEAEQHAPNEVSTREQEADQGPPPEALAHYNRGREHYQAGRYREALIELEVAMQLDPASPNLVYNVARVYELLGEIDHAIAFYKRYRNMLPASEHAERERTTLTLLRLEGAREQVSGSPPSPRPPAPLEQRKRHSADATFWVFASATVLTRAVRASSTKAIASPSPATA
jgi:tetratricopeptide (TPR) repeat protein